MTKIAIPHEDGTTSNYQFLDFAYNSREQIDAIVLLEQKCRQYDQINLSAGIGFLAKEGGDNAILCYLNDELVGLLIWYMSDGVEATIHGMVHPDYRRHGIFSNLLQRAQIAMREQGIISLAYKVLQGSKSGFEFAQSMKAVFQRSEYSMEVFDLQFRKCSCYPDLLLCPARTQDFEFLVQCSSQAFGDTELWTRDYFLRTDEPDRKTYVAVLEGIRVGIIRINHIDRATAVIHNFCILPSCQGKGIGQAVLTKTVNLLLEEQCTHIRLGVVTENSHAMNLYRQVGFVVTSEFRYYSGSL